MSTMGLIRSPRQRRPFKSPSPALQSCPQQSAIVKKSFITTPRKPNSAKRKVAKVVIRRTRKTVDIYLEGMDHNRLNPHSVVLVRGRGPRDLPGVNYHAIRGKGDFPPLLNRRNGRSKYGAKKLKKAVVKNTVIPEIIPGYALNYVAKRRFLMYGWSLHNRSPRRRY
jgi:small subunit ribosomal protein S12